MKAEYLIYIVDENNKTLAWIDENGGFYCNDREEMVRILKLITKPLIKIEVEKKS